MNVVDVFGEPSPDNDLFLTCEHAGNQLPDHVEPREHEHDWIEDHWGWDIGARHLVYHMTRMEEAYAVLSRFSRLLCDPNRDMHQENLVRTHVRDNPVSFNRQLAEQEVADRVERYHVPYHEAVDRHLSRQVALNPETFLVSVHTFTPKLGDEERDLEVGLLFGDGQSYVDDLYEAVAAQGFDVELNEPYSGLDELIYSVSRHGENHDLRYIELEVRNDLVADTDDARRVAEGLVAALHAVPWY